MIEFTSLEVENFGPYRGVQEMKFQERHGVWIVYGPNGRGKTSLLNAFRYALYGEIRGRTSDIPRSKMVNELSRRDTGGKGRMRVTVTMKVDQTEKWEVTRVYDESASDVEKLIVRIEDETQTASKGERLIESLLPPELSDFFLFDAEDLRQYEYLLEQDSDSADRLRGAIERVLGIPVLRQVATAVSAVKGEATKSIARKMQRNEETQEAGRALEDAQSILEQMEKDRRRDLSEIEEIQKEQKRLQDELRKHDRAESILAQKAVLEDELRNAQDEHDAAKEELAEVAPDLWKMVIAPRCKVLLQDLEAEAEKFRAERDIIGFANEVRRHFDSGADQCLICGADLEEEEMADIISDLSDAQSGSSGTERQHVARREAVLKGLLPTTDPGVAIEREKRVDQNNLRVRKTQAEIDDLEDELDALGESEETVNQLRQEQQNGALRLQRIRDRLDEAEEDIKEQRHAIDRLRKKAGREDDDIDPVTKRLVEVAGDMANLFEAAADYYRERVRKDVEATASEIFRKISAEEEYAGLKINDSYGMAIVDTTGEPIPNRSAGYEHLVALGLLAALQTFSPNRGPIVVDSPFQRLDSINTQLVMGSLPDIANQTLLLVFEKQFDRVAAIDALGGALIDEYELTRISERETKLVVKA